MRGRHALRIHFTGADLARTYVADHPDPAWEIVLSAQKLRELADWLRAHMEQPEQSGELQ